MQIHFPCVCVYAKYKYESNDTKVRQGDQGNQYVIKTFLSNNLIFVKIKILIRPTLMSNSSFFTVDESL